MRSPCTSNDKLNCLQCIEQWKEGTSKTQRRPLIKLDKGKNIQVIFLYLFYLYIFEYLYMNTRNRIHYIINLVIVTLKLYNTIGNVFLMIDFVWVLFHFNLTVTHWFETLLYIPQRCSVNSSFRCFMLWLYVVKITVS